MILLFVSKLTKSLYLISSLLDYSPLDITALTEYMTSIKIILMEQFDFWTEYTQSIVKATKSLKTSDTKVLVLIS